ncbi:metallophosphoesterase [Peribacillus cavernae]|uniref:Metallophosphoesterase n=1 Tax=Peribacillus cavernae TaxID=1674310 RepID=A0A3S0VZ52_9BACI|nr:metallophosphoesterase [Peribacillus cavernae]MDQ0219018.1 putative MPP superfamily phosphohydrolase [Peribacillus cavernae]RUQ29276.1 metallophosphoesterase [Peribacillus cavernae]
MTIVYSAAAILLIVIVLIMVRTAFVNKVVEKDLFFDDFPETFRTISVFFISDIHRRLVTEKLLDEVRGKADIVIIGGDITEKGVPMERIEKNIVKLKGVGPLYFVWGNNDYEADYHMLDAILLKHGVKILDNTLVVIESDQGEKIELIGIDDISMERDRLDLALSESDRAVFKILVSHNPLVSGQIKDENNISLVLSGHTHGGQIRFFGFGPYELGGMKKQGSTLLLTSNGYGTSTLPLRLGAEPETHLLHLKKSVAGKSFTI